MFGAAGHACETPRMTKPLDVISQHSMFSNLSKAELRKVAKLMTSSTIRAGKEFITEGANAKEAYIVIDGAATVRRGGRIVASVGPGDVLGEMALVANIKRTATVTADTDLTVECMTRTEFLSLLDQVPQISKKLLVTALERIHELEPSIG